MGITMDLDEMREASKESEIANSALWDYPAMLNDAAEEIESLRFHVEFLYRCLPERTPTDVAFQAAFDLTGYTESDLCSAVAAREAEREDV